MEIKSSYHSHIENISSEKRGRRVFMAAEDQNFLEFVEHCVELRSVQVFVEHHLFKVMLAGEVWAESGKQPQVIGTTRGGTAHDGGFCLRLQLIQERILVG